MQMVITYLSLSICLIFCLLNSHLGFIVPLYADSYSHEQTKRAYKDFVGQFDSLTDEDVRWTPYTEEDIAARAPQGLLKGS
jgi:hypothetical protein